MSSSETRDPEPAASGDTAVAGDAPPPPVRDEAPPTVRGTDRASEPVGQPREAQRANPHHADQLPDSLWPARKLAVATQARAWQVRKTRCLYIVTFLYALVVLALLSYSGQNDGLWVVKTWEFVREEEGTFNNQSLWWTTVPALFFSALVLFMNWCYQDIWNLMPFFSLYRHPTAGVRSVLLDYRTEALPKLVHNAWRHNHGHVAWTTVISTLFAVAVVPLSAHLFETKLRRVAVTEAVGARQLTTFSSARLSAQADYGRAFEIASAQDVYGSAGGGDGCPNLFTRWRADDMVFPTYGAMSPWPENRTVTIQNVPGYAAELSSCRFLNRTQYRVSTSTAASQSVGSAARNWNATTSITAAGGGGNGTRTVIFRGTDDGCLLALDFEFVPGRYDLYFESGLYQCPTEPHFGNTTNTTVTTNVASDSDSKMFFLMAWPGPASSNQSSFSLSTQAFSCQPEYYVWKGDLSITTKGAELPMSFHSRSYQNSWSPPSGFLATLLAAPSASSAAAGTSARIRTSALGNLILSRFDVTRRDPAQPWNENDADTEDELREGMFESAQAAFRSVMLAAMATMALNEIMWPLDADYAPVVMVVDVEKLFAFPPIAVPILLLLVVAFFLACSTTKLSINMRSHDVDLPPNLVAYYGLLHGCTELDILANDVYRQNSRETFIDTAKRRWNLDDARFWIEADGTRRRLRVKGLQRMQEGA